VLSLCAGDGRDLVPVLAERQPATEFAVLVEKDPALGEAARRSAAELQVDDVMVITGDAGDPSQFADAYPVDLLLLCGVFGNISEEDIKTTIAACNGLLRDNGAVIWTLGHTEPDLRPSTRRWFEEAGLRESAFDSEPAGYGVGVNFKPPGLEAGVRQAGLLFRFVR
jgi:hypothetical protein